MRPASIPLDAKTRWPDAHVTSMVFILDPPPNTTPTIGAPVLVETVGDQEPTFRVPWKPTREEVTAIEEGAHLWLTIRASRMPLVNLAVDTIEPVPSLTGLCDCHPRPVDVDEHCAAGVHCTISNHVCAEDRRNRDHQAACCNCREPLDMLVAVAS